MNHPSRTVHGSTGSSDAHRANVAPSPSGPEVLLESVARVGRQARSLLLRQAFGRWAILMMSVVLLGVLLDIYLQLSSAGARWGVAMIWLLAAVTGYWVWIRPAWKSEDLLSCARWIEKSFPDLGDRLSTTIELLRANQTRSIKPQQMTPFGELAIATTCRDLQPDRFTTALDTKPTRNVLGYALMVAGLLAMAAMFPAVRFSATRLSLPFLPLDWPHPDRLELIAPARVHADSTVAVEVVDHRSPLPPDVVLLVKSPEGTVEQVPPNKLSTDRAQWTLKKLSERTLLRAIGGVDRNMPWRAIEVTPGPTLVEHQWHIVPPAYTGQPEQLASGQQVEALVGSSVTLELKFDQPLQSAQCISDDQESFDELVERSTFTGDALRIDFRSGDPKRALGESTAEPATCDFFIRLTDQHLIASRLEGTWKLRFVADLPPQVSWLQPSKDLVVSARANVQLQWEAEDDLNVVQTDIRSEQIPSSLLPLPTRAVSEGLADARRLRGEWLIDLEQWPRYRPGEVLVLEATAIDQLGQRSATAVRQIRIIGDSQIEQMATELQRQAFHQAQRAAQRQQQAMAQVMHAIDQAPAVSEAEIARIAEEATAEQLAAAEELGGSEDSASVSLLQARELLKQNRVAQERETVLQKWWRASSEIARQMSDLERKLGLLARQDHPQQTPAQAFSDLQQIAGDQQALLGDLEKLLDELGTANDSAKSEEALNDVGRRQEALRELTAAAQQKGEASPQLAKDQRQLAQMLERVIDQLQQSKEQRALRAADRVEQEGTSLEMLEAAAAIDRQQLDLAIESQERIQQALDDAQAVLSGRQPHSSAKGDQDSLRTARRLRDRQQLIVEQLPPGPNSLQVAVEESALANESQQLTEQLEDQPSIQEALGEAAKDLQTASIELTRPNGTARGVQAARDALARLDAIVDALDFGDLGNHKNLGNPRPRQETASDAANPSSQGPSENEPPHVSETQLRLWRNLQAWLKKETEQASHFAGRELQQRQEQIAANQEQLALQAERGGAIPEIPQQMRSSSDRLRAGKTALAKTTQQQVIDRLDDLIEQIQQAQQTPEQKMDPRGASPQQQAKQQGESQSGESSSKEPSAGQDRADEGPDRSNSSSTAGAGGPSARGGAFSKGILAPRPAEALSRGVWGHLPERIRRDLDAITTEQYHPKYRKLIEDYYRRLSELEP